MTLTPTTSPANASPGDTPAPALTPRQEAFARNYAASGNGAAAARAAGYAPASAKQAAHELLQAPMIRDRVAALEEAHGRTLRGEAAVLLDRLDAALDLARLAGDYRAMLDVARLQAQVAALTGTDAAQRRALLYDRAGGPARWSGCATDSTRRRRSTPAPVLPRSPPPSPPNGPRTRPQRPCWRTVPPGRRGPTPTGVRPRPKSAAKLETIPKQSGPRSWPGSPSWKPSWASPILTFPYRRQGCPWTRLPNRSQPGPRAALLASAAPVRVPDRIKQAA